MNEMQVFDNEEFGSIRTLEIDDGPWFVGKDVATALGYSNTSKAVSVHVDTEDKQFIMLDIADSQNGNLVIGKSKTLIINESGLYCLILSSKLPTAKKFKRWVTSEVLPALRVKGSYTVAKTQEVLPERPITRDDYLAAARILAGCRNERMPIVITMLDKAGLDMEEVKDMNSRVSDPYIDEEQQMHLRAVLKRYSREYCAKKLGISSSLVSHYMSGLRKPRQSRYRFIISMLDPDDGV